MKETKKKESFFAKKSVYVTLVGLTAIVVIALTMNLAVKKGTEKDFYEDAWEEALEQSVAEAEKIYKEEAQAVNASVLPENVDVIPEEPPAEIPEEQGVETAAEPPKPTAEGTKSVLMEKPVPGGITKDFSGTELVYSDTMEDWRVHEGIDFGAEEKSQVKAVADGTVERVNQDGLYGACLIISHPDGIQTFYGNLEEGSMPAVGTQVKTGQVIGKVGKTATVEINDAPHLHFEVRKDGKIVNPHDFMGDTVADDE